MNSSDVRETQTFCVMNFDSLFFPTHSHANRLLTRSKEALKDES